LLTKHLLQAATGCGPVQPTVTQNEAAVIGLLQGLRVSRNMLMSSAPAAQLKRKASAAQALT
jgi:hypothetical protein